MKQKCGCELTDDLVFKPCKPHWEQMVGEYKKLTKDILYYGEAYYEKKLGIKVVDA